MVRKISEKIEKGIEINNEVLYKYALLTSVDVERCFSSYKWILSVKRNRLNNIVVGTGKF